MTYYLGKVGRAGARLVSSCKDLYNDVNAAYLTGATDVIVVKQKDGTLKSSPFHVRFGKLGVLRTGDLKEVEIEVNGTAVDLKMKIDETGKVFFSHTRTHEKAKDSSDSDKEHVAIEMDSKPFPQQRSCLEIGVSRDDAQRHSIVRVNSEPISGRSSPPRRHSEGEGLPIPRGSSTAFQNPIDIETVSSDEIISSSLPYTMEAFSDSAMETQRDSHDEVEIGRVLPTALSDTEVEVNGHLSKYWECENSGRVQQSSKGETSSQVLTCTSEDEMKERLKQPTPTVTVNADRTGFWGTLTGMLKGRHARRFSSVQDGIYLDDIDDESMDPEELSKFFPNSSSIPVETIVTSSSVEAVGSSGIGSSPSFSLSPSHSISDLQRDGALKENLHQLISTLDNVAFSLCGGLAEGTVTNDSFQNSFISFADFCADPIGMFSNPNLVVRVAGKFHSWKVAAPLIMSTIVYLQVLPQKTQNNIIKTCMPKKTRQSFWGNFWGRGQKEDAKEMERAKSEGATPVGSPHKWAEHREDFASDEAGGESSSGSKGKGPRREILSSDEDGYVTPEVATRPRQRSLKRKKTGFTNLLTSEQLESLSLKLGANKVVFSITTKYQGTAKANCTVYLWNHYDKIVVSDIDGTITRSDVAGQVLPLLGMDWTQNGVVELFNGIKKNGYKIIYLSARAIGQAGYTKEFLRNVRRGSTSLPDGPLFLFPFSLYKAFRKEVIEKRPEDFKINCLKQIRALFPSNYSPMHAGFGNRHNDVKSYKNVGIPEARIFTVNHKGILKHELSLTFQSSYMHLREMVDRQFPPIDSVDSGSTNEESIKEDYNTFNYWRIPVDAELPFELPDP